MTWLRRVALPSSAGLVARILGRGARVAEKRPAGGASGVEDMALHRAKADFRRGRRALLEECLRSGERLSIPTSAAPRVSILMAVHNQAELMLECLRALGETRNVVFETIVVDNNSTDETRDLFDRVDGVRYIRNSENVHFLRAINQAAERALGDALLILNNDTRPRPDAIANGLELLDGDATIDAVGGKLILLDGALQEAGSIVWRDASCLGHGRGRDPAEPEFQFQRDVDYCSGAFLLTRRSAFERAGGFDRRFAPAYYEEADLCLLIQESGGRVVYDPRIEVTHFEFGSAASSDAAIALQVRNRHAFLAKHRARLERSHRRFEDGPLEARMRPSPRGRVLFVDDRVPDPRLGSGYPRSNAILAAFQRAGAFVTFYPMTFPEVDFASARAFVSPTTEIAAGLGAPGLPAFLAERAGYYDMVFVSRPHNLRFFRQGLDGAPDFLAGAPLVYDAEAIFALRDAELARLRGRPMSPDAIRAAVDSELALARGASVVSAVNEAEAERFRAAGFADTRVLGDSAGVAATPAPFAARRDFLFLGAIHEASPNEDSLIWFIERVMPRLDRLIGFDWRLNIAGICGSKWVRALAGDRVVLVGRVDDATPLYDSARVFIAPTRYAAGIPRKVIETAAVGLPAVVTPLLASQLGWRDGAHFLVGGDAEAFAAQCARLWRDERLWNDIRRNALARVAADCDPVAFDARVEALLPGPRGMEAGADLCPVRALAGE